MKTIIVRLTLIILCYSIFVNALAKVDPPNYNFSLDQLAPFYPGQSLQAIQEKYGFGDLLSRKGSTNIFRFYLGHIRYKFPIFVQVYNNTVLDFHARLPHYFLHDVFHQSLINRIGKQNKYFKSEEQAVYVWNEIEGNRHTYSGACSITCYPIFYSIKTNNVPGNLAGDYKPVLDQLANLELWGN